METLASALLKRNVSAIVVAAALLLTGVAAVLAAQGEQDDDLLAFLPQDNPDVRRFYEINRDFGGLQVALVGVETPELFTSEFLGRLKETTEQLNDLPQIDYALSIINVDDVSPDPNGGVRYGPLVEEVPASALEEELIRDKVMSRDHLVGELVSEEGDAVLIYCFLAPDTRPEEADEEPSASQEPSAEEAGGEGSASREPSGGTDPRSTAIAIRKIVDSQLGDWPRYWGGAPFVSTYIYDTAQADMDRLTPWSVLAIVLILMITFGDLRGSLLSLAATGMGIAVSLGTMTALQIRYNIVLSSMPVILFAVGSAYTIHILSHYYAQEPVHGRDEAIRRTLVGIGPTVIAAGLTTVAGLLSFVAMDIEPMRTFGIFTALGIFATLVLSVTFVPAVLRLVGPRKKARAWSAAGLMMAVARGASRRRVPVGVALGTLALVAAFFVSRVQARMDNAAFFDAGSEPDLAERFLSERFGGSQFIQLHVVGDLKAPSVLLDIQQTSNTMLPLPSVTAALHISGPVGQANEVIEGIRSIPTTRARAASMLEVMSGNKALDQLANPERTEALVQLKLSATRAEDLEQILAEVRSRIQGKAALPSPTGAAAAHVVGLCRTFGIRCPEPSLVLAAIEAPQPAQSASTKVAADLEAFMGTDEFWASLPESDDELPARLAGALAALGDGADGDAIASAAAEVLGVEADDPTVDELVMCLGTPLRDLWAGAAFALAASALLDQLGVQPPEGGAGERFLHQVAGALADTRLEIPADAPTASWSVSGLPVLYNGLEQSVTRNQWRSLGLALILVVVILSGVFRSVTAGLLATVPTFLTLLAVYGAMGALGLHLDIGTSMLASLIIGAGVDYAVHMVAAWRTPDGQDSSAAAAEAARSTGPAIWTNATMVAAGFFVLTLGEARPLKNVGLLTASAMLIAAATTFVAIPVLARKRSYSRTAVLTALNHGESS